MKFRQGTDDLKNFLHDKPYYESKENFCLGNSLEDAGKITGILYREQLHKLSDKIKSSVS